MAKTRRTWSESKKRAVLQEIATATSNGGTIQSVLEKHNISHGMYKRWEEALGVLEPKKQQPTPQSSSKPRNVSPRPTTLHDAIEALRAKRDMLNEVIEDLARMEKV